MTIEEQIGLRFKALEPALDERIRRLVAAAEASVLGHGGIAMVSEVTGLARNTIVRGLAELDDLEEMESPSRVRKEGGGRKRAVTIDPAIQEDLERLVNPTTRGDPMSPLRWTCKSLRNIEEELRKLGHNISYRVVGELLKEMDYSLQGARKTIEGTDHPDRNEQFEHINAESIRFFKKSLPVISIDTKKKEIIGNFKNQGREWHPQGMPEKVSTHDFPSKEFGRVAPYGVYDIWRNEGWVSVGIDHDTAEFAVESIRRWWRIMGQCAYPNATRLLITADCGGSNGARVKLWKVELQKLADETGLQIWVCHFPPGTSKWNKIEHQLFSHITQNWRGKPLVSYEVIVNLIANTTTSKGLTIKCELDTTKYTKGQIVSKDELSSINISPADFHGDWNYVISPN